MSKSSLKNKVDSIRRTLKTKGFEVASPTIEFKILELYPDFEDEWSSDARAEVIRSLMKDLQPQPTELAISRIEIDPPEIEEINTEIQPPAIQEVSTTQVTPPPEPPTHPETSGQLTVSNDDKQAIVSSQSEVLGISLSEEEAAEIADSIDDVFDDYSSFITTVTTAIKSYIAHKFDEIENSLETNTTEVRDYLASRTNRLNQKLSNYADSVKGIKADTQVIRQNLKSTRGNVLSRFRVGLFTSQ